jgi:uncharacterized protein YndB with AHSA1/START domain
MTETVRRELQIPRSPEKVWRAIANSASLAQWMYPNNFEPVIGHQFNFHVPPNPKMKFDGLVVDCKVLQCDPPRQLVFSWSAGGAVVDTKVSFYLEPDGEGTRLLFEHSGFDLEQPFGSQAFKGATYGWAKMLEQLSDLVIAENVERS